MAQENEAKSAVKSALGVILSEMAAAMIDLGGRWAARWAASPASPDIDGTKPTFCVFESFDNHRVSARASDEGTSLIIEDDGRAQRFVYSEEKDGLVREGIPGDALSDPVELVYELIHARGGSVRK